MQAEKTVEQHLMRCVKKIGGFCVKLTMLNGIPDRLVLLPKGMNSTGRTYLVELKAPGGRLSEIQKVRHKQLKQMGFEVYVLWTVEQVDEWLKEIENGQK